MCIPMVLFPCLPKDKGSYPWNLCNEEKCPHVATTHTSRPLSPFIDPPSRPFRDQPTDSCPRHPFISSSATNSRPYLSAGALCLFTLTFFHYMSIPITLSVSCFCDNPITLFVLDRIFFKGVHLITLFGSQSCQN